MEAISHQRFAIYLSQHLKGIVIECYIGTPVYGATRTIIDAETVSRHANVKDVLRGDVRLIRPQDEKSWTELKAIIASDPHNPR